MNWKQAQVKRWHQKVTAHGFIFFLFPHLFHKICLSTLFLDSYQSFQWFHVKLAEKSLVSVPLSQIPPARQHQLTSGKNISVDKWKCITLTFFFFFLLIPFTVFQASLTDFKINLITLLLSSVKSTGEMWNAASQSHGSLCSVFCVYLFSYEQLPLLCLVKWAQTLVSLCAFMLCLWVYGLFPS